MPFGASSGGSADTGVHAVVKPARIKTAIALFLSAEKWVVLTVNPFLAF